MENSTLFKTSVILALLITAIPVSVNAEDIEAVKKKCGMCHGADGNSPNSSIPSIAGITKEFFAHTMDAYQNNGRPSDLMKPYVHNLSAEDIDRLADFYAEQTFKPVKQKFDPEKAKRGKVLHDKYCEKCHENAGRITENNFGYLAGQWTPYLRQAIQDYLDKKRHVAPMMVVKIEKLQEEAGKDGIEDVLNYYASITFD